MFVGGTGRVGSSAAAALLRQEPGVALVLAGRTESSFAAAVERHPSLRSTSCAFAACDCSDPASLAAVIAGADLVVHSAGPFQGGGDGCAVLDAAIDQGVPYLDVCDDAEYAKACKSVQSGGDRGRPVRHDGRHLPRRQQPDGRRDDRAEPRLV